MSRRYDPSEIEPKWQQVWADERIDEASEDAVRRASAVLRARHVPVPVGRPAHGSRRGVQWWRRRRPLPEMRGYNVLHPIGWDAFGLPAENAAIKRGVDPAEWTDANIEQQAGRSSGWACRSTGRGVSRRAEPEYYRWTQWLFLRFFDKGLAYRKESPVNWCPNDQTVLANEQVIQGACERCGAIVERRELTQWFFRITDYAQRLLDDVDTARRVARARADDAAQLDRAQRGRAGHLHDRGDRRGDRGLHDASRHAVGRHVLRVLRRAPGGRATREARGHLGRGRAADRALPGRPRSRAARPPTRRKARSSACTR